MSEEQVGEKTEQPTPKKLEEALKRGQFAKSAEIQTVFVLTAGLVALLFSGPGMLDQFTRQMTYVYGHLESAELTLDSVHRNVLEGTGFIFKIIWPLITATMVAGVLAGSLQSRFRLTPETLELKGEKLNPVSGLKRVFSFSQGIPTAISIVKLTVIIALTYGVVRGILKDPIFYTPVNVERIALFMAGSAYKILLRICLLMVLIAVVDFLYQKHKTHKDLMMTRQELQDETKNQEGNPEVKARQRKRNFRKTTRQMLSDVPEADAVITNPTHLAVALRYDRKSMQAPVIIAKGARRLALRIREIAQANQVPIIENKPLARMMFKYGRVDGEIPAEFYNAVAEILAYVYRVNAYRYYREKNQT